MLSDTLSCYHLIKNKNVLVTSKHFFYTFISVFTTKTMHRTFTLIFYVAVSLLYASEPITIKGIIKDKETDEAIPFAHVIVGDIINVSNVDGEFIISAYDIKDDARVEISYMGYNDYSESIKKFENYHTIYLEPSLTQLGEVTVLTGTSIMDKVFSRFHLNYEVERQHMIGYYQESMSDWEETYYIAEGIMDIYTPSNMDKYEYPLVRPLRTRKKVFHQIDAIEDVLGGNASDMAHSSIWREESFLSPKNRENYDYFYSGATTMGIHDVLIVDFEPSNKKGNTKGTLYVEEDSHAILKIEYDPIITDFSFWESVSWTEEYKQQDGVFKLVSVSFSGTSTNHEFNYDALLVINESRTINQFPEDLEMLSMYDAFLEQAETDFSDSFWTGFNFMKLDTQVAQLLGANTHGY
ncbi:MAG: hypothetical protein Tsb0034_04410 [Ekhidna sp.]